jgi:ABC-2 type transport system permease protein
MYKLAVIAYREYVAMVGTKAFIFSLVMMPILMFGSFLVMPALQKLGGGRNLKILVADGTGVLFDDLRIAVEQRNEAIKQSQTTDKEESDLGFGSSTDFWTLEATESPILTDDQRLSISQTIKQGEVYALFEIPADFLAKPPIEAMVATDAPKFYAFDSLMSQARSWFGSILTERIKQARIQQFGLDSIDPKIIVLLNSRVEVAANRPIDKENQGKPQSVTDGLKALFLPFGVMMLMFMVILMAAQPMLESAMEEKTLRISEVLIGSVTSTQLLGGKLIGNVAGSLVIFLLYGCGGVYFLSQQNMLSSLPMSLLPWFVLFQLLGVLFFSSIFLVVGSSVNELKEAQSLLLPVWMMLMAPVMVWFVAVRDPNGIVATALSFFPPSCPMTMILRLSTGTAVPWWHPFLAAIIMIASTIAMVKLAGRIYRVGLLKTDGVRSIVQLLRRATQGT